MNQPTVDIEILPQGVFIITLTDGNKIKGRFSLYALDRFCSFKEINYLQLITKITLQMRIREYAELVKIALQDYYRLDFAQCPWTEDDIMDKIFDPLGFGSGKLLALFKHAVGRLTTFTEDQEADAANEKLSVEEKKSKGRSRKKGS